MLPRKMLPRSHPDGIHIACDDHRRVNNAGLILPATLAQHLGRPQLVRQRLDLGNAPGRANTGDKMMTLVASALAGGDCIDDADVLRTGRTAGARLRGQGAIHPGDVPAQLTVGQVRQLDRVSRELLARAWAAGAGPGDTPLTIDLDSTICETYGLAEEDARHHGYTGQRGLSPGFMALTPVVAGRNALCQRMSSSGRATGLRRLAFGSHCAAGSHCSGVTGGMPSPFGAGSSRGIRRGLCRVDVFGQVLGHVLEHRHHLRFRNRRKILHKVANGFAPTQMVEEVADGHPGTPEYPGAAEHAGAALHGGTG